MTAQTPPRSVFHAGEEALQALAGAQARLAETGPRVIREVLPEQHRSFFAELPFAVLGALDADGQPWATAIAGPPGFITSPTPERLRIGALPAADDPAAAGLAPGAAIGLLGLQPHTRRRNRANGRVAALDADGFTLAVEQSFGNCPKYIHARRVEHAAQTAAPAPARVQARLDGATADLIRHADTFFIATAHPDAARGEHAAHGVDVSHRGGRSGFVGVDGDHLWVPDFAGNQYFNTLGNLLLNPRAGLLFVNFSEGSLVWIAATAQILHDGRAVDAFPGAQRVLQLTVHALWTARRRLPLHSQDGEASPFLAGTGIWPG
ncbi:MAG TPA: pyridoxamine 5'-phosphate oxidase family protein [Rhodocyclaceae bacterium]|nr:pyridoxamine 5'-phosphate oxidase family protein [Rhodocyclaceae bacterium]